MKSANKDLFKSQFHSTNENTGCQVCYLSLIFLLNQEWKKPVCWSSCCYQVTSSTSYIFVMENYTWSAAQSYCRTYHTDLTSIRSKEEKSNITLTLNGSGVQYVWIGLYRDPWAFWSENTTSTFTNWMSSQPNNYNSQYCGALNLMSGKWADDHCSRSNYFFCFTGEVQRANTVRSCHHVKH
uniref:C-type lectin domain-containing protein n=1 Tax=Neolamprologus brichardi TaxID=32507 RepID=A0A3Q4N9P4_NEOBR